MATDEEHPIASLSELPCELILSIFAHLPAPSLREVPSVSRTWKDAEESGSEFLWRALLLQDMPLWSNSLKSSLSPRSAYKQATDGSLETDVQVINRNLRPGYFGACSWATATFAGTQGLIRVEYHPHQKGQQDQQEDVSEMRVRRQEGEKSLVAMHNSFYQLQVGLRPLPCALAKKPIFFIVTSLSLQVGQVVELQWKKSDKAPFTWWFALVHQVESDDSVVLHFPQYATSGDTLLTGTSRIHRIHGARMHGGIAGGVRQVSPQCVLQWWWALGTETFDCIPGTVPFSTNVSADSTDKPLDRIRAVFLSNLPRNQPSLSIAIAQAPTQEANTVIAAVQKSVDYMKQSQFRAGT